MTQSSAPSTDRFAAALRFALLAFLFAFLMLSDRLIEPPAVRPTNAPDQFDTARAFARISRILGDERPHPVDSLANHAVRDRLLTEISALGLVAQTDRHQVCDINTAQTYVGCTTVENLSFRLGPDPKPGVKQTIMLLAHYDSVPAGPGAGDDMIGVATLLELAFHLKDAPLTQPILALITDGEEIGLFGAQAFVEQDPRFGEINMVVNFEARGVGGPAFMFETSQPNGVVMPAFMKNVKRPVANSTMAAVYEAMPNGTDLTEFLDKDIAGLNFAVTRNERFYHTPRDNLNNLSKHSLQHMGDLGLSTVRTMAGDTPPHTQQRMLYADILSRTMLSIPHNAALPILGLGMLLAGFALYRDRGKTNGLMVAAVIIAPIFAIIIAATAGFAIQFLVKTARGDAMYWIAHGWATLGFAVLIGLCVITVMIRLVGGPAHQKLLSSASWLWFLIAGVAISFALPGAAILFVMPAGIFILGSIVGIFNRSIDIALSIFAGLLALCLWAPLLSLLGSALGYGLAFVLSVLTILLLLPSVGLLAMNPFRNNQHALSWVSIGAIGFAMIAFAGLAIALPKYSHDAPRHLNIDDITDVETGNHFLAISTLEPANPAPPKSFEAIGSINPPAALLTGLPWKYWHVPLSPVEDPIPPIELIALPGRSENTARYHLQMGSASADRISVRIPQSAGVSAIEFGEQTIPISATVETSLDFICYGQSCAQTSIVIEASPEQSEPWILVRDQFGSSAAAKTYTDARPDTAVARQTGDRSRMVFQLRPKQARQ